MAEVKDSSILIQDIETKNIMTKSTLPVGGYSVNPYVGCTHSCKYCYASFMKRFTCLLYTSESKEGKLIAAIIDVLDDMSEKFSEIDDELCDVEDLSLIHIWRPP